MHIPWCRSNICNWNIHVRVPLMLDDPLPVQFLFRLKHISLFLSRITWKSPPSSWLPSEYFSVSFNLHFRLTKEFDSRAHDISFVFRETAIFLYAIPGKLISKPFDACVILLINSDAGNGIWLCRRLCHVWT